MMMSLGDDTVTVQPLSTINAQFLATQDASNNDSMLPLCSSITTEAGFVGPINCLASNGNQVNYTPAPASGGGISSGSLLLVAGLAVLAIAIAR
jgi:hypothetical protein